MKIRELEQITHEPDALAAILDGIAAAPEAPPARWFPLSGFSPEHAAAPQLISYVEARRAEFCFGPDGSRITRLRAALKKHELHGFIIPRADEHQGEYVPLRADRLNWISGFTGSAGVAVVMRDNAAIFIDGRYTLQVRDQVDSDIWSYESLYDNPPAKWLQSNLSSGQRLGYDPRLHTINEVSALRKACLASNAILVPCNDNPLDAIWDDQPPPPIAAVSEQGIEFAGRSADDKRHQIGDVLLELGIDATVLTAPDSIAWLLNIRGGDVPRTPLPLSFAVLHSDGTVDLFIDERKLVTDVKSAFGEEVRRHRPDRLLEVLQDLGAQELHVQLCSRTCADWFRTVLEDSGATVKRGPDPCVAFKARKNEVELEGMRAAHRRDGAALTSFLCWLDTHAPHGEVDELKAEAQLHAFRAQNPELEDLSFDTISGAGSNGAIVHYRATEATNQALEPGSLYLVDSGGQYRDGTTDVTRTVAIGTPTHEMRDRFTRVLQGHIRLARVEFPESTSGAQLDVLARMALWEAGLDYDHGTGHGVGSYLAVHEGPQNISRRLVNVPLEPGMIVSNEPGYYKTGEYGIRIENLVAVIRGGTPRHGEREMLRFETLTLAPIDTRLVLTDMLSASELEWLNTYHARVRETLMPLVDDVTAEWLKTATAAIQ